MSVRTFLQEDDQTLKVNLVPDVVFQRLKLKFTGLTVVEGSSLDETKESKTFLEKVRKNPSLASSKDMVFIFSMEAVTQVNDPN